MGKPAHGNALALPRAVNPVLAASFAVPAGLRCARPCQGAREAWQEGAPALGPAPRGRGRRCWAGAASGCLLCPAAPSLRRQPRTELPGPAGTRGFGGLSSHTQEKPQPPSFPGLGTALEFIPTARLSQVSTISPLVLFFKHVSNDLQCYKLWERVMASMGALPTQHPPSLPAMPPAQTSAVGHWTSKELFTAQQTILYSPLLSHCIALVYLL